MMKWIFGVLVLANVIFFAVMQWGGALTEEASDLPAQAALNADKIRVLAAVPDPAPVSAVVAAGAVAASAVHAVSQATEAAHMPPVPRAPATASASAAKLSCMEWGEFSGADLARAGKSLASMKLGDRLKQRVSEHANGYWVYIPPMKTHAQTEQKVAQLKVRGVQDYFVIQEAGPWQNAISLGVFKTEDAAKKYLAKLQEQGVRSAVTGERASKLKSTVFLLNSLERGQASQVAALRKDFPDSELKLVPCN